MGYDISQEQHERLESNRAEGRLCAESTRAGGCFGRATRRVTQKFWPSEGDKVAGKVPSTDSKMVFCARHARQYPAGYEGLNFTVLSVEKF